MKAIILASGAGTRLRPLTDRLPNVMIKVRGRTILDYQLKSLTKHGINEVVITTGPFKEKIEKYVCKNHAIKAQFIHNPKYKVTNYIYTLWLTKNLIDSDVLLLHGDLLFDDVLIGKLIEAKGNRVFVNREIKPPEKDFKALIENDRIIKIGVELSGRNAYFCAPMYKFSKADFLRWLAEIDGFIKREKVNCYAEEAFNEISREIVLRPLYFEEFCMEIDTMEDLEKAQVLIYPPLPSIATSQRG